MVGGRGRDSSINGCHVIKVWDYGGSKGDTENFGIKGRSEASQSGESKAL